ncbi:ionic transporter y4hA [Streptomyces sp. WAC05374]|uniref:calcium:proton antiporter n=1 Tax=Streptomyces sp. WAC05374 TaxID=2487420 RepID=UPI000F876B42|nr:ionic transporter y4hA [Streptomyces sp. WAC05374]TDF50352.1 ionic transporter y4hA [Streptomyces sp. WAC05374]TDF51717.1 ionic transporter y4hA [Streptomyces sp. WAC05374]TDF60605.1 ionic transporter y4hA [Streptomyces sp. WAC05374]
MSTGTGGTGTDTGTDQRGAAPGGAPGPARQWTTWAPVAAVLVLAAGWGRDLPGPVVAVVGLCLIGSVLSAVHHAEVVAHRVGEPFGSLVLAVAVTVIEVGLIVMLMAGGGDKASTYARDTVFAAVMITCNGIVGLSLLVAALHKRRVAVFNAEGSGGALATVLTLAAMTLVLPSFTTSRPGPEFTGAQLAFAAGASLCLYGIFVAVQTVRHRDYFLPVARDGAAAGDDDHAPPPTVTETWWSLGLLLVALVAVVGNAKLVSPTIEDGVESAGLPKAVVGVVIALMVLLPESLAAVRAARRDRVQTSLNLAYGSAIASIGLTIPVIALATVWLSGPLVLGLGPLHLALLTLTAAVSALTVVPGRATLLQGGVHLVLFAAFVFLSFSP